MNWYKLLARLINWTLWVVYFIAAMMFSGYARQHDWGTPLVIVAAMSFAGFMIISMGWFFSLFPHKIRKYWENRTPENPDGYG